MNLRIILIAISLLAVCKATADSFLSFFPTAPSGGDLEKFKVAAENFILSDSPLKNEYNRNNEILIKEDERDWEEVLAKIMAGPETYGLAKSAKAFSAAQIRGKARDSRIIKASRPLLAAYIKDAEEKYERFSKIGEPKSFMIYVELSGSIPSFLEIRDAQNLLTVLEFLNSPSEEKIGLLEREVPRQVAAALREYGGPMHVQESRALVEKLRDRNKSELADDINRSIERIEKDTARKASANEDRNSSGSNPAKADAENHSADKESKEPWIVGAIVAGIALIGAFTLFRRKG